MKRRKLVKKRDLDIVEISIETTRISYDDKRRDEEITLWNLVLDYVTDNWPETKLNHANPKGICVVGNEVLIGNNEYQAANPDLFKYIDDACRAGATLSKGSRRLRSKWTMESAADLKAMHGLDVESFFR